MLLYESTIRFMNIVHKIVIYTNRTDISYVILFRINGQHRKYDDDTGKKYFSQFVSPFVLTIPIHLNQHTNTFVIYIPARFGEIIPCKYTSYHRI